MKTKHIIFIFAGIFWLTLQFTQAQTYKVYKFQHRANGQYLSVGQTSDGTPALTLTEKTLENRLNQSFILKELSNGSVLITTAQNPSMFLKNDGTFEELADGYSTAAFEWKIKLTASSLGTANDQLYCMLLAVNPSGNPVLGVNSSGTVSFQALPTDIYNNASEIICFKLIPEAELF